jgi:hypothetical protein
MGHVGGSEDVRAILMDQRVVIREELGEPIDDAALATLSPADREEITAGAVGWIDVDTVKRYKDAVGARIGQESLTFQRWIVGRAAARTVRGIWRMLLAQVWDAALVKRVPILYQRTFDRGAMTGAFDAAGKARIVVTGWPGIPEYDVVGLQVGIESILSLTGRKSVSTLTTRTTDGVAYDVRWL